MMSNIEDIWTICELKYLRLLRSKMSEVKWSLKNIKSNEVFHITKPTYKVGRHIQADIKSELKEVSRNHATLSVLIGGNLFVHDNKSCNGTFINQRKIQPLENVQLNHLDIVGFGMNSQMLEENSDVLPLIFEVRREEVKLISPISDKADTVKADTTVEADTSVKTDTSNKADTFVKAVIYDKTATSDTDATSHRALTYDIAVTSDKADSSVKTGISNKADTSDNNDTSYKVDKKLQYSIHGDDCITISDGEDDELFAQSQIFDISEKIKKEQTSYHDSIDPYFEVKQELHDLHCDVEYQITVDLTDDIDHFETTADLLNILESSESLASQKCVTKKVVEKPGDIIIQTSPKRKKRKSPTEETSHPKKMEEKKIENQRQSPLSPELKVLLIKEDTSRKSKQSEKEKRSLRTVSVTSPTDVKSRVKNKEYPSKRKSTKTDFDTNKKIRSNSNKAAVQQNEQMTRNKKKEIAEERKKKLYKIAVKRNHDLNPKASSTKVPDSDICVIPSTSSGITRDPRQNRQDTTEGESKNKKVSSQGSKNDQVVIQDTTISTNFNPKSNISNRYVAFPQVDLMVPEDRSGLIWNLGARNPAPPMPRHSEDLTEEIQIILRWAVKWLVEQNSLEISPPVYGDHKAVCIPIGFQTYSEYKAVMSPLILLELWQLIYQTAYSQEDERKPVTVFITHERKADPFWCLDCQVNMSEADLKSNMFRPEDFCLIEAKVTNSNLTFMLTSYGYIKYVNKTSHRTGYSVNFTLLTKICNKTIIANQMLVKVIGNVSSSFRLFKTMKCLVSSSLCKYVFNPSIIEKPRISSEPIVLENIAKLNDQQRQIVAEASEVCMRKFPGFYLIKGPPGTGKSTVIVNIILNVLSKSIATNNPALILLTAPSNAAVDGLVLKLMDIRLKLTETQKKNLKLIRIGPDSSISHKVNKFKLSFLARKNIIRNKGLTSMEDYNEKSVDSDHFLRKYLGQKYLYEVNTAEDVLLQKANVICTTLNSCVTHRILSSVRKGLLKFTCCIIDEATQCNEIESLIPIQVGIDKFVLVGDPQQLPAVVCNKEAQKLGYGNSLFSRIDDNLKNKRNSPVQMLTHQYRMKSEICYYPNRTFYEGKLRSYPVIHNPIKPDLKPYLIFNLTRNESRDTSDYVNSDEVQMIGVLLKTLKSIVNSDCEYTVGIITPYKAQKEMVSREISNIRMPSKVCVTVNTVDSFQGLENDIIIISCVRYTTNYFLQNERRLNVALTRAKQALYIIGNYTLFKNCKPLYDLREDAKRRKCLLDITDNPKHIQSVHKFIVMD
ncbi:probable helicase senataxin isoform X2 [Leptinotarsa decemlineata]|uniref:probable helicase senataxin isoform X2 n=1 Tax=Leptinotarsa decemlineata TaxID=7539 RepID=UPI003D30AE37